MECKGQNTQATAARCGQSWRTGAAGAGASRICPLHFTTGVCGMACSKGKLVCSQPVFLLSLRAGRAGLWPSAERQQAPGCGAGGRSVCQPPLRKSQTSLCAQVLPPASLSSPQGQGLCSPPQTSALELPALCPSSTPGQLFCSTDISNVTFVHLWHPARPPELSVCVWPSWLLRAERFSSFAGD